MYKIFIIKIKLIINEDGHCPSSYHCLSSRKQCELGLFFILKIISSSQNFFLEFPLGTLMYYENIFHGKNDLI